MYFTFPCTACGKKLRVPEEAAGRKCRCPYCQASVMVPAPPEESEPAAKDELAALREITAGASTRTEPSVRGKRPRGKKGRATHATPSAGGADRTDVSMIKSGLLGLALAVGFLAALFPFRASYFGELFMDRGWVPYALVFLMGWSVAILFFKSRKLKSQKGSMLFDLLPTDISKDITVDSVGKFVQHIQDLPIEPRESFLVNRVVHGLEHFRARKSNPEVATLLASHSEIDANSVQSSYTLINVFIWAIPILGFIGTVIGISAAVGGFSGSLDQAQDISVLKDSLNGVTGGLATAFDTTLVALVMSMLVMYPSSSKQKAEEELLTSVGEYCNENLVKRFDDGHGGYAGGDSQAPATSPAALRHAIDAAMVPHHAELKAWNEKLDAIGEKLSQRIHDGYKEVVDGLGHHRDEAADDIRDLDAMVCAFQRTMTTLAEQALEGHKQSTDAMRQSAESLRGYFDAMERGLAGLNGVLEGLGQRQVVVQTAPRRRWFFFRGDRQQS
ncbi:MAG: MotA/TolQ/ExbB proton channel family protein [Patescibacteria group bacterium]|nr:MotA/TolQ/ExbB proton channel family protein [Patescibacteria group bacterium]